MNSSIPQSQQLSEQQIIRRHGFELTSPLSFTLPTATNHTSLIRSLFRLFADDSHEKTIFDPQAPKTWTILDEKMAVLHQSNKMIVIYYNVLEGRMIVESKACYLLSEIIRRIVCAFQGHHQEKSGQFLYFAVEYVNSSTISLFKVDNLNTVSFLHDLKESQHVLALRFISNSEMIVLSKGGKVSSYAIKEGKMRQGKRSLKVHLEDDQFLKSGEICTVTGSQHKILLFYLIFSRKHQKYQLHLNEYIKDINGHLQGLGTFYDVFDSPTLPELSNQMLIYTFGEGILIHQGLTVYVLQKRFGKYIRSDVISQLSSARRVVLIERGEHVFLCSMGEGEVELWEVLMKDVGCSLQLLDVVEADGSLLASTLIKAWIFVHSKKPEFALVTDAGPRQIKFYLTHKLDKLSKLTGRVRKEEVKLDMVADKTQKSVFVARLRQMEELGGKLGFRRREFYLKLWHESEKNSAHIIQFLLPCKDFKIIFNEIALFLRVKKLTVTETIRILKRIEQSLLEEMTHKLELELVRQFLKTNFQRRKLKLYSGEVQLDFQQYQNIYETTLLGMIQRSIDLRLFPEKFKHDIVWKEQVQEKPIEIPYILREFRLLILEDYPGFLLKLLQPYGCHLQEVVQTYPYLLPQFPLKISIVREELVMLSNIYETEKIEEQQYSWLGYIRENEWQREASSLDFLHRHLFPHHPTSLIADKLRQFTEGIWCERNRYSRHILLKANQAEFQAKLPTISDGSSLLFLCERANRLALETGGRSESQSIVMAMHKHNNLPLSQYYRYKLYCSLHYLLIRERLLHPTTTIIQIMQLTPEKLVACFFLGDRERIDLLFKVVSTHYPSKAAFNTIVQAFVNSEECSKVELQMLAHYLRKAGESYQAENQDLIGIVLRGFLKRIQVREKDKAADFLNLFRSITLAEQLLITLALFQSVKSECAPILKVFDLTWLSYDSVINDPNKVITCITQEFFSSPIRHRSIYIEGREVSLAHPQNLFVIILYLKDKVYSFGEEMEIYLVFCEAILAWNQFDLLRHCFSSDIIIDDREYLPEEFYSIVVNYMLEKYYEDQTLLYCEETKEHINNLLALIDPSSPTAIIQRAKMQFVEVLEPLGQAVSVQYMQIIREQWQKEEERSDLFKDIIDLFPHLDFQLAVSLYQALETIRTGTPHPHPKTDEFVRFALYICRKYVDAGEYVLIIEVISFLNAGEQQYRAKYSFMVECFLQVLNDRLQSPHLIRQSFVRVDKLAELAVCRQLIDYFLFYFGHPPTITAFFASKFQREQGEVPDQLDLDPVLNLSPSPPFLSRGQLWQSVVKRAVSSSDYFTRNTVGRVKTGSSNAVDTKSILFTYYFICNILQSSGYLFQLQEITFNHLENVGMLQQLGRQEDLRYGINFKLIYRLYLKGLFKLYYLLSEQGEVHQDDDLPVLQRRVSQDITTKIREIRMMEDSKLILLICDLPLDKGNLDVLRAMKKLIPLFQTAWSPPEEKSQRTGTIKTVDHEENSLPLYFQAADRELKESATQLGNSERRQPIPKTFRFGQFERVKQHITTTSNVTSEKLIIGKVLDQLENNQRDSSPDDSFRDQRTTIQKLVQEKEVEQAELANMLEDLNREKSNELIALDLSEIGTYQQDQKELQRIRELIEGKEYQQVTAEFPPKAILKALGEQFYRRVQSSSSKPKKRIVRSNTLKEAVLTSHFINLLEALDGLKLYGSSSKVRLLRSSITTISSEELQSVESFLLGVFRLNVLLDSAKNTPALFASILPNIKQTLAEAELGRFKLVVRVVQEFMRKCRQEEKPHRHNTKSSREIHEAAQIYYQYLCRLANSAKNEDEKIGELEEVMGILGKTELLIIHERLLEAFSQGDLYLPYLELIHKLYGSAS